MVGWATLPEDLLHLISKFLESSFDFAKFRSVCSSWRSAAEPKRPRPIHHLPIPGGNLYPASTVGFFRLSQRSILVIKPHEPQREANLSGWLVKVEQELDGPRNKVTFLDPLCGKRISLPEHLPRTLDMSRFRVSELGCEFKLHYCNVLGDVVKSIYSENAVVKYLDSDDDCKFVLLTIHVPGQLAMFRSWEREWTVINDTLSPYYDVILFDGRFYAVDNDGRTVVVDYSSLELTLVANPVFGGDKKFLIESCGEMFLVDMYLSIETVNVEPGLGEEISENPPYYIYARVVKLQVFKFVESEKSWVKVEDLGDKMLFLGDECTFSASVSDILPLWRKSSVFFKGNVFNGKTIDQEMGVFDFMTGKIEMPNKVPEYAKLFCPPPHWITSSHECVDDHAGETSSKS